MIVAKVRVFQDVRGEYRFTAYAANGEPIKTSSVGYVHYTRALEMAVDAHPDAEIVDESEGVSGEAGGA